MSQLTEYKTSWVTENDGFHDWDLISPHIDRRDSAVLCRYVKDFSFNRIREEEKRQVTEEESAMIENFADNFIRDIYSLYVNPSSKTKFKEDITGNEMKQELLQDIYNYYVKIPSEGNTMYSGVLTGYITSEILKLMKQHADKQDNPGQCMQDMASFMQGGGQGDGSAGEQALQEALKDKVKLQDVASKASQKATEQIQDLEGSGMSDAMANSDDSQQKKSRGVGTVMQELADLMQMRDAISALSVARGQIADSLEKILKYSYSYFSRSSKVEEYDLLDAEELDQLDGLENLLPILKKVSIANITSLEYKPLGKVDFYIDCSGSMSRNTNTDRGRRLGDFIIAKGLAINLMRLNLSREIRFFASHLFPDIITDAVSLMKWNHSGGTSIDTVIEEINNTGMNSIVLTDACCPINVYSSKCFFICINMALGASGYYRSAGDAAAIEAKFYDNGQVFGYQPSTGEVKLALNRAHCEEIVKRR